MSMAITVTLSLGLNFDDSLAKGDARATRGVYVICISALQHTMGFCVVEGLLKLLPLYLIQDFVSAQKKRC